MSAPHLAILVGSGDLAQAILRCRTLLTAVRIASWCPFPARDAAVACVGPGLEVHPSHAAQGLVSDGRFSAVLLADEAVRSELILAALAAGKGVLCSPGSNLDPGTLERMAQAERNGGGCLACPGLLAHTLAGARGLEAIARGELGAVQSAYLAIRAARSPGNPRSVLDEFGWDALDFLTRLLAGPVATVYASGGALFAGSALDTAVMILRTEGGSVGTIELSRCLPGAWSPGHPGEAEIEVIAADETLRITPFPCLTVARDDGVQARPLLDPAWVSVLDALSWTRGSELVRYRTVIDILAGARSSLASGEPVTLSPSHDSACLRS